MAIHLTINDYQDICTFFIDAILEHTGYTGPERVGFFVDLFLLMTRAASHTKAGASRYNHQRHSTEVTNAHLVAVVHLCLTIHSPPVY